MKYSNGFNKKQKEEIREIIRYEIREALRRNAKPDIKVKDEVREAIYSILNDKNDNLIKNLIEIEDKINKEETEKSMFAANIKWLLYVICLLAWFFWIIFFVAAVYTGMTDDIFSNDIFSAICFFLIYILFGFILFIFGKSIKHMNKNDSYNSLMFIITMVAFILTIYATF